jgi:hypothetical protein
LVLAEGYGPDKDSKLFWNDFQNADDLAGFCPALAMQNWRGGQDIYRL